MNDMSTPVPSPQERPPRSGAWSGLLLLFPVLCCGGPLLFVALATASALTQGIVVGALVAGIGGVGVLIVRRRARSQNNCCAPMTTTSHSKESRK